MNEVKFLTKKEEEMTGKIVHQYRAFEGDFRYIINDGKNEYRCKKDANGIYRELVI